MKPQLRKFKPSYGYDFEKYLVMIKPGSKDNSIPARIDIDLENAIKEFAARFGTSSYLIRNIAVALGLAIIEKLSQDQIRTIVRFFSHGNVSS